MDVPRTLRTWFLVHAAAVTAAALPLLIAPEAALGRLGWTTVDPVAPRLLGAALLAIGAQSFFARDANVEIVRSVLRLNLVWSLAGAAALFVGVGSGAGSTAPNAAWIALSASIVFAGVWLHHAIRFRQLQRVAGADDGHAPEGQRSQAPEDHPRDE